MKHDKPHPLAGKTVLIKETARSVPNMADVAGRNLAGQEYVIEDWWDRVAGKSWMDCNGNPACMNYGMRSGFAGLPTDDEVVYGKIGHFGHLIHVSELGNVVEPKG